MQSYFAFEPTSYRQHFPWDGSNTSEITDKLEVLSSSNFRYTTQVVVIDDVHYLRVNEEAASPSGGYWDPTYVDVSPLHALSRISEFEYNQYISPRLPLDEQPTSPLSISVQGPGFPQAAAAFMALIETNGPNVKVHWPHLYYVTDAMPLT